MSQLGVSGLWGLGAHPALLRAPGTHLGSLRPSAGLCDFLLLQTPSARAEASPGAGGPRRCRSAPPTNWGRGDPRGSLGRRLELRKLSRGNTAPELHALLPAFFTPAPLPPTPSPGCPPEPRALPGGSLRALSPSTRAFGPRLGASRILCACHPAGAQVLSWMLRGGF